jgi:EmrB/QacA subfamily drug resistance transporter
LDRRWWVALNVSIGVYMSTLDASVVNISLPTITQSLRAQIQEVAWVVTAYLIVITGCLLLMGRLADLYGQRRVYLFGFLTFTLGSALCGFSPTIYFLIGSRMLQGLGASGLMAIGPAILVTSFREEQRGQALGIVGSVVSAGFLTGPVLGGFLVEHLGWRSVFFINLPIGALGVFLSARILEERRSSTVVRLDLKGAFSLFLLLASLLLASNRISGGVSGPLLGWFLLGVTCLAAFIWVETRTPHPLVDLGLFRRRLFISSLGASLLSFWMSGAHSFVVPFFLQGILKFSPSKVGMLIFPVALTVMIAAPLGGRLSDRVGVRVPATIGLVLISFTIFSFTFLEGGVAEYQILWRQIVAGMGIGLFNPANNSAIIGSLPKEKAGLASSFLALSRNLGMVMGVAFAEMVLSFRSPAASLGEGGPSLESIRDVWRIVLIIGLTAIVVSWIRDSKSKDPHIPGKTGGGQKLKASD